MKQSEHYLQPYYFSMESAACMSAIGTFLRDKLQREWHFFPQTDRKRCRFVDRNDVCAYPEC